MMMTSKDVSAIGYSLVFIVRPSRFSNHCEEPLRRSNPHCRE
jgi:hypothetical protein